MSNEKEQILKLGEIVTEEKVKFLKDYLSKTIDSITSLSETDSKLAYVNGVSCDKICLWHDKPSQVELKNNYYTDIDGDKYILGFGYDEDGDLYFCSKSKEEVFMFMDTVYEMIQFVAKQFSYHDKHYIKDFDNED